MLDERHARVLAEARFTASDGLRVSLATELREGWYFTLAADSIILGARGVVVNKRTGALSMIGGIDVPVARQLELYDLGYQFERYDLTILAAKNVRKALATLEAMHLFVVEPPSLSAPDRNVVRDIKRDEHARNLAALPSVYRGVRIDFAAEILEKARRKRWLEFEIAEHATAP